jgi:hypothetical protein
MMRLMRNRNNPVTVTEAEGVRQRFVQWRQDHPERPALPAALWSAATEFARRQGVSRTARSLALDYHSLQQRVEVAAGGKGARKGSPRPPSFVELMPSGLGGIAECSLEVENAQGSRMKIQLRGAATGELSGLTQLLWRGL